MARRAVARARVARNVIKVQPGGDGEDAEELRHRLRSALALVDAAYGEVGRLERLRKGDRDDRSPPA